MGTITSSIGLISGINTGQIIDELMSIESQPKTLLQTRIDSTNQQKLAYTDLLARLSSLQITGQSLEKDVTYQAATATSGDPNVLTASAAPALPSAPITCRSPVWSLRNRPSAPASLTSARPRSVREP